MGRVPEPHASPKAPVDRAWDRHGTAEADKSDAILEQGGWKLLAAPTPGTTRLRTSRATTHRARRARTSSRTMSSRAVASVWFGTASDRRCRC